MQVEYLSDKELTFSGGFSFFPTRTSKKTTTNKGTSLGTQSGTGNSQIVETIVANNF